MSPTRASDGAPRVAKRWVRRCWTLSSAFCLTFAHKIPRPNSEDGSEVTDAEQATFPLTAHE